MSDVAEFLTRGVLIGLGAAALMDAWALFARRAFSIQGLDYALLGRWIGHFPRRRFFHERIASADPIRGERPLGWVAHYSIGIAFAFLLLAIWGLDWARSPTIWPAMLDRVWARSSLPGSSCSPGWAPASRRRERRTPAPHGSGTSQPIPSMESGSS